MAMTIQHRDQMRVRPNRVPHPTAIGIGYVNYNVIRTQSLALREGDIVGRAFALTKTLTSGKPLNIPLGISIMSGEGINALYEQFRGSLAAAGQTAGGAEKTNDDLWGITRAHALADYVYQTVGYDYKLRDWQDPNSPTNLFDAKYKGIITTETVVANGIDVCLGRAMVLSAMLRLDTVSFDFELPRSVSGFTHPAAKLGHAWVELVINGVNYILDPPNVMRAQPFNERSAYIPSVFEVLRR